MSPSTAKSVTLRRFIFFASLCVSCVTFFIVLAVSSYIYERQIEASASRHSYALSRQIFVSMSHALDQGWSRADIARFLTLFRKSFPETMTIGIFRGTAVQAQYGAADAPPC